MTTVNEKQSYLLEMRKRLLQARNSAEALQLLACGPFGAGEVILLTHGFTRRMLAGVIQARLAIAQREIVKADRRSFGRVLITETGRRRVEP